MAILVTGGTGKTGSRLVKRLHDARHPVVVASRSGNAPDGLGIKGVRFDWTDPSTFTNPFEADSTIDRMYIVCPHILDTLPVMKPFIDLAVSKGVKRFVLLSGTTCRKGDPAMGQIHGYLVDLGVDYCVLRSSWFFDNFAWQFLMGIRHNNEIATTAKDGKVPFVAVDDIADAAFKALTDEKSPNKDLMIVGPELLTYDEAAALLSEVIGRKITHKRMTYEEGVAFWKALGLPEQMAQALTALEGLIAVDAEEAAFNVPEDEKYVGKRYLKDWFEENKKVWAVESKCGCQNV